MTGDIVHLHSDPHEQVSLLLPWYLTDTLASAERVQVEAHLRTCLRCQADLMAERRLRAEVANAESPGAGADAGWTALRAQMGPVSERPRRRSLAAVATQWRDSPSWLRWAVAAQFVLLLLGGALVMHPWQTEKTGATYHALGAATAPSAANVVVMFRPEATERDLRTLLTGNGARLVDGPTAAGAYLLHVPAERRTDVVAQLRRQPQVTVAETIDPGAAP